MMTMLRFCLLVAAPSCDRSWFGPHSASSPLGFLGVPEQGWQQSSPHGPAAVVPVPARGASVSVALTRFPQVFPRSLPLLSTGRSAILREGRNDGGLESLKAEKLGDARSLEV